MDQTTGTQTDNSTDTTARPSFDRAPLPPAPPLDDAEASPASGFPAPGFPASGFPAGPEFPGGSAQPADPTALAARSFRLRRSRTDRMIGGVCGGLAQDLGVDAALLRIGLVLLTVLGGGIGAVLYVAAWMLAPQADGV